MLSRLFDIAFACIGLLVFAPIIGIISLLIYLEDRESVFFTQTRIGKHKRPFTIYKFRTMRNDKVTKIGKWLRGKGIDETIQFFNVLKGDMSMVGPRPLTQQDIERLKWDTKEYEQRWSVPPGITGLAQIFGGHSARVSWFLDRKYFQNASFLLDFQLIVISFVINIFGKKKVRAWLKQWRKGN